MFIYCYVPTLVIFEKDDVVKSFNFYNIIYTRKYNTYYDGNPKSCLDLTTLYMLCYYMILKNNIIF